MKDLVIGFANNYDWTILKFWANSLDKTSYDGDKCVVLGNVSETTVKEFQDRGWKVICLGNYASGYYNFKLPPHLTIHLARFDILSNLLNSTTDYEYVIHTDTKDVVFQNNPSEFVRNNIKNKKIMCSSESMRYGDEPWGAQNMIDTFGINYFNAHKNDEIFNVGVLAGELKYFTALCDLIFQIGVGRQTPIVDQSTFNYIINSTPWKDYLSFMKSEDGFCANVGTTIDPSKISNFLPFLLEKQPIFEKGICKTSNGIAHCILHQYDRVPDWKKAVEQKYG